MNRSIATFLGQKIVEVTPNRPAQPQNLASAPSLFAHRQEFRRLAQEAAKVADEYLPSYLADGLPTLKELVSLSRQQRGEVLAKFFNMIHGCDMNALLDQKKSGVEIPRLSPEAETTASSDLQLGHQAQRATEANPQLKPLTDYYAAALFMTARRDNPRTAFAAACLVLERFEQPRAPRKPTADPWQKIFARLPRSAAND